MTKSSSKKSCGSGFIRRKAYSAKRGSKKVHVSSKCIRATSKTGQKRSVEEKKILQKKASYHKQAREKFGTPRCPKGTVVREGTPRQGYVRSAYVRKSGTSVKKASVGKTWMRPTCVKATGKAASTGKKGKQLFVLEKGDLSRYGYHNVKDMTEISRHKALKQALKHDKPLSLFRKVRALWLVNRNKDHNLARIYENDANWIKTTPEYKNRETSGSKK